MDGDNNNNNQTNTAANGDDNANQQAQQQQIVDYSKIEGMINKGVQQKESAILKSYFEQQGMTEDEIKQAVSSYKADRAKKADEEKNAFTTMQSENAQLKAQILQNTINGKATEVALDMGVDKNTLPYVLKMADMQNVVNAKGEIAEDAVKNAIEKVLKDVPALKVSANANTGFKVGANGDDNGGTDEAELRKLFGLKPRK